MRSNSGCTIQQALTPDAAAVVKQAVTLAKRRGHAQVTPLHVASTMLSSSSSSGLLRAACQQSHSHPLQCRALELCFNVALNRLPTTASVASPPISPMLGPPPSISPHQNHQPPSISNALVAAFKRAQAHQRRGSIENQQQPLLAVKIELEQLVISILDDPSVSRVMREAGFSSTLVKAKVEQAVSAMETTSSHTTRDQKNNNNTNINGKFGIHNKDSNNVTATTTTISGSLSGVTKAGRSRGAMDNEDAMRVIDGLVVSKRKRSCCVVVVGECLPTLEAAIEGAMGKVERGDRDVPDPLRKVKFVPLPHSFFEYLSREGVEQKVAEITCVVKSYVNKGVIFYLGDLEWANAKLRVDASGHGEPMDGCYCPIEHMMMELRRLVLECSDSVRLWLVGIATFQTYTKCQRGHPTSLESVWGLHAITIPAGTLGLSLNVPESDSRSPLTRKKLDGNSLLVLEGNQEDKIQTSSLTSRNCTSEPTNSSSLPSWLQKCKDERKRSQSNDDQESVSVEDPCKTWIGSMVCSSTQFSHPQSLERTLSFPCSIPPSSASSFSYCHFNLQPTYNQMAQPKSFPLSGGSADQLCNESFRTPLITMYIPKPKEHQTQTPLSSSPMLTCSSEIMEIECVQRFKEYNVENLKILCNALEKRVPWQKDIIPDIANTILHCRGGRVKRLGVKNNLDVKEETWLFFQGVDANGKEKIARELACLVFGSSSKFVSIGFSSFSSNSTRADSMEDSGNKRLRDELSCSYLERLTEAVSSDPHMVFFLEDIEQVDYCSQMGIKRASEKGKLKRSNGEEVGLGDSIIILSCESFSSRSWACSPSTKLRLDHHRPITIEDDQEEKNGGVFSGSGDNMISPGVSLDLNISVNDDNGVDQVKNNDQLPSFDEIGLLDAVDKCIVFKF